MVFTGSLFSGSEWDDDCTALWVDDQASWIIRAGYSSTSCLWDLEAGEQWPWWHQSIFYNFSKFLMIGLQRITCGIPVNMCCWQGYREVTYAYTHSSAPAVYLNLAVWQGREVQGNCGFWETPLPQNAIFSYHSIHALSWWTPAHRTVLNVWISEVAEGSSKHSHKCSTTSFTPNLSTKYQPICFSPPFTASWIWIPRMWETHSKHCMQAWQ